MPAHEGPTHHAVLELWTYSFPLSRDEEQRMIRDLAVIPPLMQQAQLNLTGNARDLWVAGIRNIGRGMRSGELIVELDLSMYVGAPDPRDEVYLHGTPDVNVRFEGGIPGDSATVAVLVNNLQQVVDAAPGLKTVLDLPPPRLLR